MAPKPTKVEQLREQVEQAESELRLAEIAAARERLAKPPVPPPAPPPPPEPPPHDPEECAACTIRKLNETMGNLVSLLEQVGNTVGYVDGHLRALRDGNEAVTVVIGGMTPEMARTVRGPEGPPSRTPRRPPEDVTAPRVRRTT